ncbi:putative MFS family arabinose efflux permease [Paenibacillus shirakamiensis]|uniref:MFS family arabinose efflux permease n=1 Tax=Paenibacillus shirakamiensis TaxID=1265935 RepID=A0ABS4JHN2_9BACL|nr:MFS transporter [Paenibacillus shirakamiensis]MBP2001229.1 putative MFS family arabinose efflux permease [Paenibacillus shirakamiensis]
MKQQQHTELAGGLQPSTSMFSQPKAVWAVAFACVISFMGLGLVDPILPAISEQLHASKSQVSLLFTSYNLVTGVAMLITGIVSSRFGVKWTLMLGMLITIIFASLGGLSDTIGQIVGFRAGWGLGNALFIATALSAIVNFSTSGTAKAIILYEAALGLGISVGPLLGGELGSISWRGPFFGVSVLMLIGFIFILFVLPATPKPKKKSTIADPFKALGYPALLTLAIVAFLYNFGFFTLMAYSPYVMHIDIHKLGYVFFGWGIMLAFTSVVVAPRIQRRISLVKSISWMLSLFALDLVVMAVGTMYHSTPTIVVAVIVAGIFLGINNTLITTAVMQAAPVERATASAAYSFVRFLGGALSPWLAGKLSEDWSTADSPFLFGALMVLVGVVVLIVRRGHLSHITEGGH